MGELGEEDAPDEDEEVDEQNDKWLCWLLAVWVLDLANLRTNDSSIVGFLVGGGGRRVALIVLEK